VVFVLTTPDAVGGTERATFQLVKELAARSSLDVSILGVFRDADEPPTAHDANVELRYLVDRRTPPVSHPQRSQLVDPRWEPAFSIDSDEAMRTWVNEHHADVMVATTPSLLALLCQLVHPGTAVVGVEHRATAARGVSGEPLRAFSGRADAMISLTAEGSEWFRDTLGPDHPLLAVIPNLIPDEFVPRSSCRQPMIIAAGRMIRSKQFHHVVEAFGAARQHPWRLRIFGDGPERSALQRAVLRHGLHDHVELVRHVPDLRYELAKASMLVMASTAEGLPLVALEALAAGVPIVSYDCPVGPRALIDDGVNGLLVPSNDVDALGTAVRYLIEHDDERVAMGARAVASTSRFDADAIVEKWVTLIETVASGEHRRRNEQRVSARLNRPRAEPRDQPWVPRGGLLVHIGPHKTGTTALQSALAADREALARWGVRYPGTSAAPHGAVMARLGTNRGWDDAIAPGSIAAWEQLCIETRVARETVVVSSEALCHATSEQATQICSELRHGPVRAAITLRPLAQVLPSSWQEYVKSGWTTSYDDFLRAVLLEPDAASNPTPTFWVRHDHGRLVRRWADAIGADNVVVIVADPERPSHLFQSFEQLLGLPQHSLVSTGPSNRSLTFNETELLRRLNVAVRPSLAWSRFNQVVRQGGTPQLVEQRTPPVDEPRLGLPEWAATLASEHGSRAAEEIRMLGVRVDGDLDTLATRPPGTANTPVAPDLVPIDAVVEFLDGMLSRIGHLADRRPPADNPATRQ
jgi:glycosyltransferase involved in cell wall biosynthesis